jgi:hypothetical protein
MMPKFTQPIAEFMYACNRLLTGTITRDTLTKEELEMLETCIELLTKRFFNSQPSGEMSHGQLTGVEAGRNSELKD